MRKFILLVVIAALPASAFAQQGQRRAAPAQQAAPARQNTFGGSAGQQQLGTDSCGLGWQVTDKKTMVATTTRGTTNAVVPATFGMTTGTLGCDQHSFAKREVNSAVYAANNFETLSTEAAQGQGEFVTAFADSMGCSDSAAIGKLMQDNYASVSASSNGIEMYKNVRTLIRSNAISCSNVI